MANKECFTVRTIKPDKLHILTQLFDYNNVEEMIFENRRIIESGAGDIFCLYFGDILIGELRVKYRSDDKNEAADGRAYLYAYRIFRTAVWGNIFCGRLYKGLLPAVTEN